MSGLVVIKPVLVTPAMLIGTDVPENDFPEWDVGATYADADRVILASSHKVYESLQAANAGKEPLTNPDWWIEVSPTNRWKAFDQSNTSQTAKSTAMYFEIEPGHAVNAVASLNIDGVQTIRHRLTDPDFGLIYDKTLTITSSPMTSGWYEWFFGERIEQKQNIDLGLPSYPNAVLRVDYTGFSNMAVGVLIVGTQETIGDGVLQGVSVGIQDYSRKEPNDFGDIVFVERAFSKRASFPILLDNKQLDNTYRLLTSIRATPCLWIGGKYASTTIYGFYKDFEILMSYHNKSDCSLDIEGLT